MDPVIKFGLEEGGIVLSDDGKLSLTDYGEMQAINYLGGRDVRHLSAAIFKILADKWLAKVDKFDLYFIVQETIKEISEKAREDDWESLIDFYEEEYLRPTGFFEKRAKAFALSKLMDDSN